MVQDKLTCISLLLQISKRSHYDRNIAAIEQYGKTEIKNIMENTFAIFYNIKSYKCNNVKMWTSSDSPYIILFCNQ